MWERYNNGATLGDSGSEEGIILVDEEHPSGARITLERGGNQPFSITCGIYGVMVHTVFASSKHEAEKKLQHLKERIGHIFHEKEDDVFYEEINKLTRDF